MADTGAAVLNSLPHPVFTLGADGRFGTVNAAAEQFFQSSASILSERTLGHFLPPDSPVMTLIEQARAAGTLVNGYRIEIDSPRLPGVAVVDAHVAPVPEMEHTLSVTLLPRAMAETLDRQLSHRAAARTVTGLAAMLAHEIKNPLSGIRGAAQLLEVNGSEDDRSLTNLITEESDRIVRLVDRMEVFSDERPVERDPINVHAVLEHVKRLARSGFARGVDVEELYDPSLPPVSGNRDQLVQVFLNLVKNACEAMEGGGRGGRLSLSTAFRPGMRVQAPGSGKRVSLPIAVTVRDDGPGVPEDLQAHLFDPFITTKTNGSGLGLALVSKIVGDHGGIVSCDSRPGATTFQVLLPRWSEGEG